MKIHPKRFEKDRKGYNVVLPHEESRNLGKGEEANSGY